MKRYIKPVIEIVELRTEERLASCSIATPSENGKSGTYKQGCAPVSPSSSS